MPSYEAKLSKRARELLRRCAGRVDSGEGGLRIRVTGSAGGELIRGGYVVRVSGTTNVFVPSILGRDALES